MKIKLTKGYDLPIAGAVAADAGTRDIKAAAVAVAPGDFPGFVPKPDVAPGDVVGAGAPLMHDKTYPGLKLVSPLGGRVTAVVRGERRKLLQVVVEAEDGIEPQRFDTRQLTREKAVALLAGSGLLAMMRRRPYDIVPDPCEVPRDIFVTAIYSAPLELPLAVRVGEADVELLELGTALLASLTPGKVYISHDKTWTLGRVKGAEMVEFRGKHPVGNVGVQISNIKPVNKGESVWTLDVETLRRVGYLMKHGVVDTSTVVGIVGPAVEEPCVVRTSAGAAVTPLLAAAGVVADGHHHRVVSGNVLVGTAIDADGYLHYPYRLLTVLDNGDDIDEFMGWASLSPSKMSVYRSFPGHFLKRLFRPDARLLGGRRAMILSGEYDAMMPMDILPEYLLKAIIARDIDKMEQLGIYEVAPEDFALAEYADTSKIPLQHIVREGIEFMRKEV